MKNPYKIGEYRVWTLNEKNAAQSNLPLTFELERSLKKGDENECFTGCLQSRRKKNKFLMLIPYTHIRLMYSIYPCPTFFERKSALIHN